MTEAEAAIPSPAPTPGDTAWFTQARFGLFVHWGLYSMAARHEWVMHHERMTDAQYRRYFERFDPDLYDPVAWARHARAAGMRYAVVTTKHHDGFCLWDSALTDFKATNTPAGRDLIRPFVDAFRAEGLRVGFYHSLIDWHHPEFPIDCLHPRRDDPPGPGDDARDIRRYADYLHGQVRELLTGYGPIDILWLDFSYPGGYFPLPWPHTPPRNRAGKGRDDWRSAELLAMVRELAPGIVVNDRADLPEQADVRTPEQYQPRGWVTVDGAPVVWETCQTLNGSWGYDRDNLDWKTPDQLVRLLIETVANGGNLLLNVGPTGRGEFDPRARATLAAVGEWMRLHARAIVGATASSLSPPPDGRYTRRGDRLYLHLFAWPFQHLYLDGLAGRVAYAQFLHDGSEVRIVERPPLQHLSDTVSASRRDTLTLQLPVQRPDVLTPVIELFLVDAGADPDDMDHGVDPPPR
jgi:alpha-L-fucosidase